MTYSFVCRENVAESAVRRGPHKKISAWTQFKFSIAMVCTVTEIVYVTHNNIKGSIAVLNI